MTASTQPPFVAGGLLAIAILSPLCALLSLVAVPPLLLAARWLRRRSAEVYPELRRRIEAAAEDVGRDFAAEARRIHDGLAPERAIIGEARPSEARALLEDGIPVAPLPWPARRTS